MVLRVHAELAAEYLDRASTRRRVLTILVTCKADAPGRVGVWGKKS